LYPRAHRHRQSDVLPERHSHLGAARAPDTAHTATGFYNKVISTNRCERNHGHVKSRLRPMRGLKSFDCAKHLFRALDAMQLIEGGFITAGCTGLPHAGGRSYVRARRVTSIVDQLGQRV
jgi:hypothetical protein